MASGSSSTRKRTRASTSSYKSNSDSDLITAKSPKKEPTLPRLSLVSWKISNILILSFVELRLRLLSPHLFVPVVVLIMIKTLSERIRRTSVCKRLLEEIDECILLSDSLGEVGHLQGLHYWRYSDNSRIRLQGQQDKSGKRSQEDLRRDHYKPRSALALFSISSSCPILFSALFLSFFLF